jgi:N-acetylglucosaminyldiphosphoundecaprenol N-acetyl-beta-D-mannosaminyltransferase
MSQPNHNLVTEIQTFSVLSLPVHLLNDYVGWLERRLCAKVGTHVVTLNAEMAILTQTDAMLAEIIQKADLVIPDGAGVVIHLRFRGVKHYRCPGIELAESLLARVGNSSETHFICFFGGSPGVSEKTEQQQWQETLQQQQPQIIFVGLGVPRQEIWIQKHRFLCPNAIWIGVGGSFDIWSGTKNRAPSWLRNNNLEWSYRLYQEPYRWRRMLALPKFFLLSLLGQ